MRWWTGTFLMLVGVLAALVGFIVCAGIFIKVVWVSEPLPPGQVPSLVRDAILLPLGIVLALIGRRLELSAGRGAANSSN